MIVVYVSVDNLFTSFSSDCWTCLYFSDECESISGAAKAKMYKRAAAIPPRIGPAQ